jgi:hypothetical protein
VDGFFGYADLKCAEQVKVEKYILSRLMLYVCEIIGIIGIYFEITGKVLITYSAFIRYWGKF